VPQDTETQRQGPYLCSEIPVKVPHDTETIIIKKTEIEKPIDLAITQISLLLLLIQEKKQRD